MMIYFYTMQYSGFAGAIFDVDDTLLDNKPGVPGQGLHERSRLAALREVGKRRGVPELLQVTLQENLDGFLNAPVHTLEAAVWNIMYGRGLVPINVPDPNNKIFQEIVALKNKMHEKILREEGEEVPGASAFVRALAANGFEGKLAIASTAVRRDIDIFLEKMALTNLFPDARIISKDKLTHAKPHPEAFNKAFDTLGLPPDAKTKVMAFEDDPRGIMSAKAAGMCVFAITTRYSRKKLAELDVPPDFIADSFAEFSRLLGLPATLNV